MVLSFVDAGGPDRSAGLAGVSVTPGQTVFRRVLPMTRAQASGGRPEPGPGNTAKCRMAGTAICIV